jgi:hypothetical protein
MSAGRSAQHADRQIKAAPLDNGAFVILVTWLTSNRQRACLRNRLSVTIPGKLMAQYDMYLMSLIIGILSAVIVARFSEE